MGPRPSPAGTPPHKRAPERARHAAASYLAATPAVAR